ncbi:hypothetical protein FKR81_16770 [Lentzea tibetensis]|uniref:Uncharacterized protein n=1 Tax=Lentzea tibetensis TaxID=2591470 RepID=A0A563EUC8_9PSEU|nr:hypothetical protein [Lentzea tibetensis]TWP51263.1 hypothetical protein FKR81_16770 [Lentzea tibetensis]
MADYNGRAVVLAGGVEYGCDATLNKGASHKTSAAAFGRVDVVGDLSDGWLGHLKLDGGADAAWAVCEADDLWLRIDRDSSFTVANQGDLDRGELDINGNNPPPFDSGQG